MKITLRHLEIFTAVAHFGQVTKAAQAVAMTQSAASMALADLESQLNVTLFDRVGRQLILNETGRLLLSRAQEVIDRVLDIEALASGKDSVFDLRLGASVTVGNRLLPELLAQMKGYFPKANVQVLRCNTEQVLEHLLTFRIEAGFVEGPVEDPRFRSFVWRQDELTVFAEPGNPLAGRILTPDDLSHADWIMREHGSGTRTVFERACAASGVVPRIALELEQPEAIRQCVRMGMGIGCLSSLDLEDAFHAGTLVPLQTPFLDMHRNLSVVIHREKYISQGIATILRACGVSEEEMSA
jgi:DNA-binding transcriptional LysR family regulator